MPNIIGRLWVLVWVGFYTASMMISVHFLIAPLFEYQGYVERSVALIEVPLAIMATCVIAMTIRPSGRMPSDVALLFLTLTTAIPVIWIPVYYGPLTSFQVQGLILGVAGCFLTIWGCLQGGRRAIGSSRVSRVTFWIWIGTFSLLAFTYLVAGGVRPRLTGFSDVYAQREEFVENVDRVGAYLVGWLAGGTLPVLLALGLYRRSIPLVAAGAGGVLLLYSLTGYRSYAIGLAVLIGTFAMTRRGRVKAWHWISLLTALVVLVSLLDLVRGGFALTSLVVRRAISTAGLNTAYYVDLFDGGPYFQLRHSVLSFLGEPAYEGQPAAVVGRTYYESTTMANANFMADGFANGGWVGMLAAALLVGVLLRFYDRVALGLPLSVSAPALVFILLALANTAALTVVSTHGAAVLFGWIALLPASIVALRRSRGRLPQNAETVPAAERRQATGSRKVSMPGRHRAT